MDQITVNLTTWSNPEPRAVDITIVRVFVLNLLGPSVAQSQRNEESFPRLSFHCSQYVAGPEIVKTARFRNKSFFTLPTQPLFCAVENSAWYCV